jgi:hypothetical protein
LINIYGARDISWLGGLHASRWLDYIRMMDLQHKTEELVEQVKQSLNDKEEEAA